MRAGCRLGNLEKSCYGLEKSCHDVENSCKMLEKKVSVSVLPPFFSAACRWDSAPPGLGTALVSTTGIRRRQVRKQRLDSMPLGLGTLHRRDLAPPELGAATLPRYCLDSSTLESMLLELGRA